MSASFQIDEDAPDAQTATMPPVPAPDELQETSWVPMFERRFAPTGGERGRALAWLRMNDEVGDDPVLQACALAYLSDDLPTDAVVAVQHPGRAGQWEDFDHSFWSASLDHAIWFHRPARADQWQLQEFTCHGLMSSRGLSVGHVFDQAGTHVATISQEVLLRSQRPGV
jgi:acyl-CoA thioesterase-2